MLPQKALLSTSRLISTAQLARHMEWRPQTAAALCLWVKDTKTTSLALGFHPGQQRAPVLLQESTSKDTATTLQATLSQYKQLPLVVGWPLQTDGGTCGAACGKVLHVLDQLQGTSMMSPLWTLYTPSSSTTTPTHTTDAFGRNPSYSRVWFDKQCHIASHEQYSQHAFAQNSGEKTVQDATDVWHTVCRDVWGMSVQNKEVHADDYAWPVTDTTTTTATTTTTTFLAATPPSLVQAA